MGMQALRLSGLLRNNPPWRLSMTGLEEVGDGVAVEGLVAVAWEWACLRPPGMLPPSILKYAQTELYDLGQNFVRSQLATINGTSVPLPYGGHQRSIMVDLEPGQLAANHLTSEDISTALNFTESS